MSRRRRAILLLGLAALLGGLAALSVQRREAELAAGVGQVVTVVVAGDDLPLGHRVVPADLTTRAVPLKYLPSDPVTLPDEVVGRRLAIGLRANDFLTPSVIQTAEADIARPSVDPGERIAQVVATGPPQLVVKGARVDVAISTEGTGSRPGETQLALQDVPVVAAEPVQTAKDDGEPRVRADLRVDVDHAMLLAAAADFAKSIRLLPRPDGDHHRDPAFAIGADMGSGPLK